MTLATVNPNDHVFWLSSRALGIVALVILAASVSCGLLLSARMIRRPGLPGTLKRFHEALALVGLSMVALHGLALVFDSYLKPGVLGILLPFYMDNQPVWTGIGIIGGWLTAVFTLSYYVRKWITTPVWRWLHRFTLLSYSLAVIHTLGSGSDTGAWWMTTLLITINAPIIFVGTYRFLPAEPTKPRRASVS